MSHYVCKSGRATQLNDLVPDQVSGALNLKLAARPTEVTSVAALRAPNVENTGVCFLHH